MLLLYIAFSCKISIFYRKKDLLKVEEPSWCKGEKLDKKAGSHV